MSERKMWHFRQHVQPQWWVASHLATLVLTSIYVGVNICQGQFLAMLLCVGLALPWSALMTRTYFEWR